jgi:hypothetical protein
MYDKDLDRKYKVGGYNEKGCWKCIATFHTLTEARHFKQAHLWAGTGLYKNYPGVRV